MENVVVHIISHSHWDREWYLSFESHRMQLVELFDNLFDLFENDPEFKSFHLDGQTIVLDDYLEIRPENRDKVQGYIDQGKLKIGPFYILQDDYLISSEANVRNTLIGQAECAKWGKSTQIGYFPDTFGNMGQAPQILQKSGIHVAAFGRGVKRFSKSSNGYPGNPRLTHRTSCWPRRTIHESRALDHLRGSFHA